VESAAVVLRTGNFLVKFGSVSSHCVFFVVFLSSYRVSGYRLQSDSDVLLP
jgi:hypothetical protein